MKMSEQPIYLIETAIGTPVAVCRNYEQAVAALGQLSEERRLEANCDYAVRIRVLPELAPWVTSSYQDAVAVDTVTSEAS